MVYAVLVEYMPCSLRSSGGEYPTWYAVLVVDMPHGLCSSRGVHAMWSMQFWWRTSHMVQVEDMPHGRTLDEGHATWPMHFR